MRIFSLLLLTWLIAGTDGPRCWAQDGSVYRPFLELTPQCQWRENYASVDELCERARGCCSSLGLGDACRFSTGLSTLEKRTYAWNFFPVLRHALAQDCCGSSADCIARFEKTALWLDTSPKAMASDVNGACYAEDHNVVRIADFALESMRTRSSIEAILLHELGHACQSARTRTIPLQLADGTTVSPETYYKKNATFSPPREYLKSFLEQALGPVTSECLLTSIDQHRPHAKKKPSDDTTWYDEAFADLIFAEHQQSVDGVAYLCGAAEDSLHTQPQVYLGCMKRFRQRPAQSKDPYAYGVRGVDSNTHRLKEFDCRRDQEANAFLVQACGMLSTKYLSRRESQANPLRGGFFGSHTEDEEKDLGEMLFSTQWIAVCESRRFLPWESSTLKECYDLLHEFKALDPKQDADSLKKKQDLVRRAGRVVLSGRRINVCWDSDAQKTLRNPPSTCAGIQLGGPPSNQSTSPAK